MAAAILASGKWVADNPGAREISFQASRAEMHNYSWADIARKWFDTEHVEALMDVAASATALAAINVAKEKNKIVILNGPGSSSITNEACTPSSVHYTYDTTAPFGGVP